jgi:hypothetical protein
MGHCGDATIEPLMIGPIETRASRVEWIATAVAIAAWFMALYVVGVRREPFGDEPRFIEIVRTFGARLDLETLRTYPAMNTPLAFLAYAAWGRIAGFEVWQLRLLSPLLAIATCVLFDRVLRGYGVRRPVRVMALAVLCLNPYFAGLGVFVFTDMLSLLATVVVIDSVRTGRAWLAGIGVAAGVLTRQYDVFVAIAVAAYGLIARRRAFTWASAMGVVPVLALMWLWQGLAPDSVYRAELLSDSLSFHPQWLSLYLAAPGIYAAPLVVWQLVRRPPPMRTVLAAIGAAGWIPIFPVRPAAIQVAQCCPDTGYVHRALLAAGVPFLAPLTFFLSAAAWVATIPSTARAVRDPFAWLALAAFLAVMPFSYMPWEKYALPQLLFVVLLLSRSLSSSFSSAPGTPTTAPANAAGRTSSQTARPHDS